MAKQESRTRWATDMDREMLLDPASERSAGLILTAFRSRWEGTGPTQFDRRFAGGNEAGFALANTLARPDDSVPLAADFPAAIDLAMLDGTNGFRIEGIDRRDNSGFSVSDAGDVNGDGFDDIIIGAIRANPGREKDAGESYVLFGKAGGFDASFDLSSLDGGNGFRLDGIDALDQSGTSVSSAGDVNGDGFDDIIIGADQAYPGDNLGSGESYVVFGKAGGHGGELDLSTLDGGNGFRIDGVAANDASGTSVSSAGDVNGDGFDDIIIGASTAAQVNELLVGESYVVFGRADGFAASVNLRGIDGNNGFRLKGIDGSDFSGGSVSSAGDVNGDGFDDIIVGAHGGDPDSVLGAGESYVVFGKAGGFTATLDLATLDGTNGFRLDGIHQYDRSGTSVSSAGDVNGDGFDDVIIGAPDSGAGNVGRSYVVFGQADGFAASLDLATLDGSNGFCLDGVKTGDRNGVSVSDAGDVNGDGFDDVIIGAVLADPGGNDDAGESYVVFGKAGGFAATVDLATLDGSNGFRVEGVDANGGSGRSVSSAGDVNGDGFDDIVIGAPYANGVGTKDAGESYVVFGVAPTEAVTRIGSAADQTIRGGNFDDTLRGEGGDDRLAGGAGADVLDGGTGRDRADYDTADAGVRASLTAPGNNTGEAAGDTYISIENLQGSDYNDKLAGDAVANRIEGRAGADSLDGRNGDDKLAGEAGHDSLKGGKGADRFEFASLFADDSDAIGDFVGGTDKIALDSGVFGLPEGALAAGAFAVGNAAGDANDRVIYNAANGNLFFDADGTGAGAQILIATLTGAPTLAASDIVVI